jgi:hypothetical protein
MSPVDLLSLPNKSDRDLLMLAVRQLDGLTTRLDASEERATIERAACQEERGEAETNLGKRVTAVEDRFRLALTVVALFVTSLLTLGVVKPEYLRWVLTVGAIGA